MKVGAITVGQAPRVDVTGDILPLLPPGTELLEAGALDGLTREEIAAFAPEEGDYILVSRLTDGSSVTFAERHILPLLQQRIEELEAAGCAVILCFCTGTFPPDIQTKSIPLLYPRDMLERLVPLLTKEKSVLCLTPDASQREQAKEHWLPYLNEVAVLPVSPYGDYAAVEAAAKVAKDMPGELIILDCIGYTKEMKDLFVQMTGKKAVLPRTLLARVAAELLDGPQKGA